MFEMVARDSLRVTTASPSLNSRATLLTLLLALLLAGAFQHTRGLWGPD